MAPWPPRARPRWRSLSTTALFGCKKKDDGGGDKDKAMDKMADHAAPDPAAPPTAAAPDPAAKATPPPAATGDNPIKSSDDTENVAYSETASTAPYPFTSYCLLR